MSESVEIKRIIYLKCTERTWIIFGEVYATIVER